MSLLISGGPIADESESEAVMASLIRALWEARPLSQNAEASLALTADSDGRDLLIANREPAISRQTMAAPISFLRRRLSSCVINRLLVFGFVAVVLRIYFKLRY
jgi:hypothetical protein